MRKNMLFSKEICTSGKQNSGKSSLNLNEDLKRWHQADPNKDLFIQLAGCIVNNTSEDTSYFFYFELWPGS